MPFDRELYESYCVRHPSKRRGGDRAILLVGLFSIWAIALILGIAHGVETNPVFLSANIALIVFVGWALFRMLSKPEPEGIKIWVDGHLFCVEWNGQRSRGYRFSEVTRVKYHMQFSRGHRAYAPKPQWQIYIGDECVAAFEEDMENAPRLLMRLDKIGLITPYGTGERPEG